MNQLSFSEKLTLINKVTIFTNLEVRDNIETILFNLSKKDFPLDSNYN